MFWCMWVKRKEANRVWKNLFLLHYLFHNLSLVLSALSLNRSLSHLLTLFPSAFFSLSWHLLILSLSATHPFLLSSLSLFISPSISLTPLSLSLILRWGVCLPSFSSLVTCFHTSPEAMHAEGYCREREREKERERERWRETERVHRSCGLSVSESHICNLMRTSQTCGRSVSFVLPPFHLVAGWPQSRLRVCLHWSRGGPLLLSVLGVTFCVVFLLKRICSFSGNFQGSINRGFFFFLFPFLFDLSTSLACRSVCVQFMRRFQACNGVWMAI